MSPITLTTQKFVQIKNPVQYVGSRLLCYKFRSLRFISTVFTVLNDLMTYYVVTTTLY